MGSTALVTESVERSGLLDDVRRVVVLLSGGQDSVCLLDVLVKLLGAQNAYALHLNYGLRPDSGSDEQFCQQLCKSLGVYLEVVREPYDGEGNLQAWARDLRYRHAATLASSFDADAIAVAHTETDRIETVLYRLLTSPGRRALLAMRPREGLAIRPLLSVSREDTAAYCQERGLSFVTDSSNESPKYRRNRIRNELLPLLRSIAPHAEVNILKTVDQLTAEADYLEQIVTELLGDRDSVEVAWLCEQPPVLQPLILRRLAERVVDRLVPDAYTRADEVIALAKLKEPKKLTLGGVLAVTRRGAIRFEPPIV